MATRTTGSLIILVCVFALCQTESHSPLAAEVSQSAHGSANEIHTADNATVSHGASGHGHDRYERYPVVTVGFERIQTPFIIGIWIFLACIGKIAFHMAPKVSKLFPESVMIIVLGLIIGGILFLSHPDYRQEKIVSPLTAHSFFIYLLPPIILDAGYFMPNRLFFDHLGTILTFAVVGTIWNAVTIGISLYALALTELFGPADDFPVLHIFLFSSLISAVDPVAVLAVFEEIHVEEVLFILVFGESLLNDGVTVVLYHMFEGFSEIGEGNIIAMDIVNSLISFLLVALGGTAIGIVWGFLTALVTRFTHQVRVIEPVFIFVMSYLSYLNAELFHFSGILAITFCGITMKNYTERNISENSRTTIRYAMKMLASSSETVIFLFLGVATVHGTEHEFNGWFIFFTIFFCSVYRTLGVLILSAVCNRVRVQKIDFRQQFMMCYGGLRGAVAFALAITIDRDLIKLAPTFVTTTIAMVFFTVFIQGTTIKPLVEKLGVKKSVKRELKMNERLHERTMDYAMSGMDDIVGNRSGRYFRTWFKRFNTKHIEPLLVHTEKYKEPKFFETLSHLKLQDAISNANNAHYNDSESMAHILQKNLEASTAIKEWNLDVGELDYEPGDRDLLDEQFHHSLAEHFIHSNKRHHSTYNRHAVKDVEIHTPNNFETRMVVQAMKQACLAKARNRKNKKNSVHKNSSEQNLHRKLAHIESLHQIARDNLAFVPDEPAKGTPIEIRPASSSTVAETLLPWKRFSVEDKPTTNVRRGSIYPEACNEEPQSMAEVLLPWKRNEDDLPYDNPMTQGNLPLSWMSNLDQSGDHYSPSNTLLNNISNAKKPRLEDVFAAPMGSVPEDLTMRNSAMEVRPVFRRRASEMSMKIGFRDNPMSVIAKKLRRNSEGENDVTDPSMGQPMKELNQPIEPLGTLVEEVEQRKKKKPFFTVVDVGAEDGTNL